MFGGAKFGIRTDSLGVFSHPYSYQPSACYRQGQKEATAIAIKNQRRSNLLNLNRRRSEETIVPIAYPLPV
jgi:hypothetical protein